MIISKFNYSLAPKVPKAQSYGHQSFPCTQNQVKTGRGGKAMSSPERAIINDSGLATAFGTINSTMPDMQGLVNFTKFYRDPELFKALPEYLDKKFPNGAPIYCYACSDGSEPYTLAIEMMEQKINKFFPLKCLDLSKEMISDVKEGSIEILNADLNDYPILKNYFKKQNYQYGVVTYNPTTKLKEKITAQEADVLEDIKKDDKFKEPAVVMFRNAWYLLEQGYHKSKIDQRTALAEGLFEKLKPGSLLIIGQTDLDASTTSIIEKTGFIPVKKDEFKHKYNQRYFVYERP